MTVDYSGDTKRYGNLDIILNPENKFTRPTLEQIRKHKTEYLKRAKHQDRPDDGSHRLKVNT